MHPALFVQEIVLNICEACITHGEGWFCDDIKGRGTLDCMSRTCQSFKDPGLDVFWREIPGIEPLLLCMSADLWSRNSDEELILRRPIYHEDWVGFFRHADRVRTLKICKSPHTNIDELVAEKVLPGDALVDIEALCCLNTSRTVLRLLPNLRKLVWWDTRDDALDYIPLFLAPTLTHLSLNDLDDDNFLFEDSKVIAAIKSAANICSCLAYLLINSNQYEPSSLLASTIARMDLVELDLTIPLHDSTVIHLSKMKNLKLLRLWSRSSEITLRPREQHAFPKLEILRLSLLDPVSCTSAPPLLQLLLASPVKKLDIFLKRCTPSLLSAILEPMSAIKTLLSVAISVSAAFPEDRFNLATFEPLLSLRQLETVRITAPSPQFDDSDYERIGQAWPHLRQLEIIPAYKTPCPQSQLTLSGLIALANHCPGLADIRIVLNATHVPHAGVRSKHGLRSLHVVDGEIKDASLVASILAHMFPRLCVTSDVHLHGPLGQSRQEWKRVATILDKEQDSDALRRGIESS